MTPLPPRVLACALLAACVTLIATVSPARALDRTDVTFKIFQFPQDQIPRIDGDAADWAIVPDTYAITTEQLVDDNKRHPKPDPKNLDIKVRVGWVKGLNRLYFLYEAYDDFWDFADPGLHNDTFEIVVDGDASGGPLIPKDSGRFWNEERVGKTTAAPDDRISITDAKWAIQGVHAQNYHIMTPAVGKDWTMAWNAGTWTRDFPWSQAKTKFNFKHGEPGKLVLEFYVTLFDYAGPEGPQRAIESVLRENKIIGASFAIIDYDAPNAPGGSGFWNLSRQHTMYGHASELCAFRLMPLEPEFVPALEAHWSFSVVDMDRRLVAFKDETIGKPTAWKWTFGDGETSTEQHPIHAFKRPGNYVTILDVTDADGKTSRHSSIWAVQLR